MSAALATGSEARAYQRTWFAEVRARVAAGEPFAVINADGPHEILRTLDIPYVVNQWWASVCSAKQRSADYLALLRERGYPDDSEQYSSLPLASSFAEGEGDQPWGGLPRPTIVVAHLATDSQRKIFELWAQCYGAAFYPLEMTVRDELPPRWYEGMHHDWEHTVGSERLDLMVAELEGLIRFLEQTTGRVFSETRLRQVMDLANEQAEYNARTRDLIARTSPAPLSVGEGITSVMLPQWHRGTEHARDAARCLYEEVSERVDQGVAAWPGERVRLMWVGRGLWFDMGFYRHFEERHDAVFVWSMYLAVAADAYLRYGRDDPLRALAARFAAFSEQINMPPWSSEWYAKEALHNHIDGVVHLVGDAVRGSPFITSALEDVGVPVLEIEAHNVDARAWRDQEIKARISEFIEARVQPRATEARAR